MKVKLPKAQQGSADYAAKFAAPLFTLMGNAAPLYKSLFDALEKYGTRLDDLKVEGLNTGNVSILFESLVPNNFTVRIRLDSLQITFHSLQTLGVEKAKQLVLDCWNAIQQTDSSISLVTHAVVAAFQFALPPQDYKRVLQAFTKIPEGVPSEVATGVAYYLPRGSRDGDEGGSIVLDRLASGGLNLRISMNVDAKRVPAPALADYVEAYVNSSLSMLGLEIEGDV